MKGGYLLKTFLVAAAYAIAGRLGFYFAISPGNVTAIWPPSGIAFAAVLVLGVPAWLGIWIGSFLANVWFYSGFSAFSLTEVIVAAFIALGSTLQAIVGGLLLRRFIDSRNIFRRPHDSFVFVGIAAASCVLAAVIGVTTLCLAGLLPWDRYAYTCLTWWAGDTGGVLVYTPLILTWRALAAVCQDRKRLLELLAFMATLSICCLIVFCDFLTDHQYRLQFLMFPFLVLAAARFGVCGVTLTVAAIEIFAVIGLKNGLGPFAVGSLNEGLLLIGAYLGIVALIGIIFGSVLTEWQTFRKQLEKVAEELELKVAQRTSDLEEANYNLRIARDQAIDASNVKSAFVANISHELRTPLSGILGMSELLLSESMDSDLRDMIQTIHDSGHALLTVVNDILDLSKIEAGKIALEYEAFSPTFLVQDCIKLLAPAAANKHLKLSVSLDSQLPAFVWGDASRIRQSLLNVVGNGVKFTEKGSVTLHAEVESQTNEAVTILFTVRDTGIGIAREHKGLLFTPFVQVDSTTTRKFGGTGLGLAISKRFIEMMNGTIGFESELHRGSTFWFKVPFDKTCLQEPKDGPQGKLRPVVEQLPPALALNRRVLIVEDNAVLSYLVVRQLTSLGMEACASTTGGEVPWRNLRPDITTLF